MKGKITFFVFLILSSCTSSSLKQAPYTNKIQNVSLNIAKIGEKKKLRLEGYFQADQTSHSIPITVTLKSLTEQIEFTGCLLKGGQIITIDAVDQFCDFVKKHCQITIHFKDYEGYLSESAPSMIETLINYLPETLFFDL